MPKCISFVQAQCTAVAKGDICNLKPWQPGQDKVMLQFIFRDNWDRANLPETMDLWVCPGMAASISCLQ